LDIKTLIKTINITQWAESQNIIDGDKYSIKDLLPWTPPSSLDIPGIVGSNGISLVYSWLLFSLILITWWM